MTPLHHYPSQILLGFIILHGGQYRQFGGGMTSPPQPTGLSLAIALSVLLNLPDKLPSPPAPPIKDERNVRK